MNQTDFAVIAVLLLVVFGFVIVLIGIAWSFAKISEVMYRSQTRTPAATYSSLRPQLQRLAQLYSGKLLPGPLYELPRLTFDHPHGPVMLEANSYGQSPAALGLCHVSIRFLWPDANLRVDIYPERLVASLQKLIGMRDIEVGDKAFDRRYMITGNDLVGVQKLLTPAVRELITLIRGPRHDDDVNVRIVGGQLSVAKRNMRGDYDELRQFVELAIALYDALRDQPHAGIHFVDSPTSQFGVLETSTAICQVCGEAVDGPEVACTRCRTPHHRECWEYFGGCAIYGCRGQEHEAYAGPERGNT